LSCRSGGAEIGFALTGEHSGSQEDAFPVLHFGELLKINMQLLGFIPTVITFFNLLAIF